MNLKNLSKNKKGKIIIYKAKELDGKSNCAKITQVTKGCKI